MARRASRKPPAPANVKEESIALSVVRKVGDFGIGGSKLLSSAKELAAEYRKNPAYKSVDAAVAALIKNESRKSFASGFATSLGGVLALPVTLPGGLAASWVIQSRLAGTIAELYGHDSKKDGVRTLATLCLLGDVAEQSLKAIGVNVARRGALSALGRASSSILLKVNRFIGFRLMTTASRKGLVNVLKLVPVIGGTVGGTIDWSATKITGKVARDMFRPSEKQTQPKRAVRRSRLTVRRKAA